ncbi:hypothetical protein M4Q70_22485, partial [Acidovorax valerianellae]|nr:hypothetical protein [Paracidovorax valerianellae]
MQQVVWLAFSRAGKASVRGFPAGYAAADTGLAYLSQVANVFPSLTVRENLLVVRGVPHVKRRMDAV